MDHDATREQLDLAAARAGRPRTADGRRHRHGPGCRRAPRGLRDVRRGARPAAALGRAPPLRGRASSRPTIFGPGRSPPCGPRACRAARWPRAGRRRGVAQRGPRRDPPAAAAPASHRRGRRRAASRAADLAGSRHGRDDRRGRRPVRRDHDARRRLAGWMPSWPPRPRRSRPRGRHDHDPGRDRRARRRARRRWPASRTRPPTATWSSRRPPTELVGRRHGSRASRRPATSTAAGSASTARASGSARCSSAEDLAYWVGPRRPSLSVDGRDLRGVARRRLRHPLETDPVLLGGL